MISAFNPYNTLPVADEALEVGGVELLRAGFANKKLFVSLHRHAIETPDRWGNVLAEITLNLATLYSANGGLTENEVIAEVATGYRDALRKYLESSPVPEAPARPAKSTAAKSARPPGKAPVKKAKVLAKSKAKVKAPAKAKAKPAVKSKSASKAVAGRKGVRG
jgi:Domain of unknown function (DUF5076)